MRRLYNILYTFFLVLASPLYLLRLSRTEGWTRDLPQRFGRYNPKLKQALTNRHVLWLHAVGDGEINVCTHLIRALEARLPNAKLVVSTTTAGSMEELRRKMPTHIGRIYLPYDRRPWVARALSTINPEAIILVQSEIWPNFLWRARQRGTPVILLNTPVNGPAYRRYRRLGFFFRRLFASLAGVGAQSEADIPALLKLGCRPNAIRTVGSLRFDAAKLEERRRLDVPALLAQIGVSPDAILLVGGSTCPGEEQVLADLFLRLRQKHPNLFLVLVPRRIERSREIGRLLQNRGVRFVYRNEIMGHTRFERGELDCLLVNTQGELNHFYGQGDILFVGKTLLGQGGQNPIEPGAAGKAMIFGPHMRKYPEIARRFLQEDAALQVRDAAELERAIDLLLSHPDRRAALGRNARGVVENHLGAIDRTVSMILEHLDEELYVAPKPA